LLNNNEKDEIYKRKNTGELTPKINLKNFGRGCYECPWEWCKWRFDR
jgi:hypothetical protein